MTSGHVYLVPGFFGFANIGDFRYFGHVRDALAPVLAARGLSLTLHEVHTRPTASLSARAARLLEVIAATAGPIGDIHLIGHSTGGLDARVLLTPGVLLPTDIDPEPWVSRVRSVISLSTPHRGAPLAAFLSTMQGQQALRLLALSAIQVIRRGPMMGERRARLAAMLSGAVPSGLAEQLYQELLSDFHPARRAQVEALLGDVASDPSLLTQLRPEGVDLINALGQPREGVALGSVVTAAPAPGLRLTAQAGASVGHQASRGLYKQLHRLSGRLPDAYRPTLEPEVRERLAAAGPHFLADVSNDGMVPVRSQVWGRVIGAWSADHLDIIGHFEQPGHDPPHRDWLFSGAGFRRPEFEALCDTMARFIDEAGSR